MSKSNDRDKLQMEGSTTYKYTIYQHKYFWTQAVFIVHTYKIGLIFGGQNPIQLVMYRDKIGIPR